MRESKNRWYWAMEGMMGETTKRFAHLERENMWLRRMTASMVILICFLIIWGVTPTVRGQNRGETIILEGQTFEVGMSKQDALARLSICCKISGRDDSYFVTSKESPYNIMGGIWFADDKVSMVKKESGQFMNGEAINFGQTLFRLLSEISHSKEQAIVLQTSTKEGSNATFRNISLQFSNGRSVVVLISKVDANNSGLPDAVDVYELLEKR